VEVRVSSSFNINVTGGVAAFGAAVQGDHARVDGHAQLSAEQVDQHFRAAEASLRQLASEYEKSAADVQAALATISALKAEAASPKQDVDKGSGLLKAAWENFSWAYPAIKDFAKAAWPLLLAAIGS
jgi:hypothetical protein